MKPQRSIKLCVLLFVILTGCSGGPKLILTSEYQLVDVEGWKVYVSPHARANDEHVDATIELLHLKLKEISNFVSPVKVNRLKAFSIWIEHNSEFFEAAMTTHVSKGWLLIHGFNPDKAVGLEICHTDRFIRRTFEEEPMVLMRHLAHAYLYAVVGRNDERVTNAYSAAVNSRKYERVRTLRGQMARAFALEDPSTYFAKLTEAFFGTNDFYPFTRSDVKEFDPMGYALMEEIWVGE